MKEKRINQKGITLVALIITIIVLLILAVVAISAVSGDGIIGHAKNARDAYNQAQITENGTLQNYADYITGQISNDEGNKDNVKKISFTIGNSTHYAEEGMTWIEWMNSSYFDEEGNVTATEWIIFGQSAYVTLDGKQVKPSDPLVDGGIYKAEHSGRTRRSKLKENFNCKFCIIGII